MNETPASRFGAAGLVRAGILIAMIAGPAPPQASPPASPKAAPRTAIPAKRPYLDAALAAARWLARHATETEHGVVWPIAPGDVARSSPDLYNGNAGVVLFLCDLARTTGDDRWRALATKGADALETATRDTRRPTWDGLYTGLAGEAFVLEAAHAATGQARFREAARATLRRIIERAKPAGNGVEWNASTDIISGTSGIGLYLLAAADAYEDDAARECAIAAGKRLIEVATKTEHGLDWFMTPKYPKRMPNFSHGTAGVAYFLATLYERTEDRVFLDAALKGAAHLASLDAGGLIPHHRPGDESLCYLGWCHGPPGTARLYFRLERATDDDAWREKIAGSADALLESGIPKERTPGYWNNVGVCCGAAGVAAFLADAGRHLEREEYRNLAKRLTTDLLSRADRSEGRLCWLHAEHRVRPKLLRRYTGLMQGAAGIGRWLLQMDHDTRPNKADASPPPIRLPDDPWG